MSNGPVAKLKVTGVAASRIGRAARKPSRHNCELRWSCPAVYLFAVAPVIYDENASADTLCPMYITCIDDASIFHRKVPKLARATPGHLTPPSRPTNPLPSNLSPRKLEAMRAARIFYGRSILSLLDWGISFRRRASPDRQIYYSWLRERSKYILNVLYRRLLSRLNYLNDIGILFIFCQLLQFKTRHFSSR